MVCEYFVIMVFRGNRYPEGYLCEEVARFFSHLTSHSPHAYRASFAIEFPGRECPAGVHAGMLACDARV